MTEKELRKLKRSDFLQLLLVQSKEMAAVQARLDETMAELAQLRANNEHLNAQNELIEQLKGNLDSKEETINALRQEIESMKRGRTKKIGSAAKPSAPSDGVPNGMRKVGKKALEQRMYQLRTKRDELVTKYKAIKAERSEKAKPENPSNPPKGTTAAQTPKPEGAARTALKDRLAEKLHRRRAR